MTNAPTWDLSDLYLSLTDPKIKKDKDKLDKLAAAFVKKYKNKIDRNINKALLEYEQIYLLLHKYTAFANFKFSTDTKDNKIKKFYQESVEFENKINSSLTFFELELIKLDNKYVKLAKNHNHYLKHLQSFKKYRLSEPEEKILTQKSQTSSVAFTRLFDEIDSKATYKLGNKNYNFSQLSPILNYNPNRKTRERASVALTKGLEKNIDLYTYILNTLLLDKKISDEIRGYKYPQQQTLLRYEIDFATVKAMTSEVTKAYHLCQTYYKTKAKILKLEKLHEWDRYVPLFPKVSEKYTYSQAKSIILDSFGSFSPEFSKIAKLHFENNWIDAKIVKNKRAGAFCSLMTPDHHPYILTNFNNKISDVLTLAHELGHAIHACLSRKQNLLQFWPSTAATEIASIFAESIVFDYIFYNTQNTKLKLNLLATKLEQTFATIFRQTAFYLFESDIHVHRRQEGELSKNQIKNYFQKRLQTMFGDGLTLTKNHSLWWAYVLHFYHYNFYVFTYAFGENLTNALYNTYKTTNNKPNFVSKYINALEAGSSLSPAQIINKMDIDISNTIFWKSSMSLLQNQLDAFHNLASKT